MRNVWLPIAKRSARPNASPYSIADYNSIDPQYGTKSLEQYKRLFRMRATHPALTSGDLIRANNDTPDSVLSFLRKTRDEEVLAIVNLSNRKVNVTVDLPVMDYSSVENLLTGGKTSFELYSGRVLAKLSAYEAIVGKRIPAAPLE